MGLQGDRRPGSLERRYEQLPEEAKNVYYLFRRHLGYTPAETDAMSWIERRMWLDCLAREFSDPDDPDAPQNRERITHSDDASSLAGDGLKVRTG